MRSFRGGPWLPVAIWKDSDGQLKALRDGAPVDAQEVWTWCCQHPVSYETYVAVAEQGQPWPDEVPAGIGHNSGAADPVAGLDQSVTELREAATAFLESATPITSKAQADKAANFAERFAALEKEAEEARTREKRPILEEGRAIDARWRPVIERAAESKKELKKALEPYLLAERERLAAEAGPGPLPPVRAGSAGRRVGLRTVRRLVVRDREALVCAYRRDARLWAHPQVESALRDLAEADLRAGRAVKGVELTDEQVAA
ncbi:hypothetical protein [Alsobacter soli]|uniref:hypothetical protein n=1 Tax=Alsobacter soli TaxID=2109933 RepID=UPI0011B29C4D|nr:hypothetical protein [Alsobacter soli]